MGIWNKIKKKNNLLSKEVNSETLYAIPIADLNSSKNSNESSEILNVDDPNLSFDSKKSSKDKAKFSIQFKLMVVISSVLAITTSAIISLATYFFKTDNKVRILETNLELVRVVELKVRADLNAVVDKGKQLALTLKQDFKFQQQREFFLQQFFKNDSNFIYLGVFNLKDDKFVSVESLYNTAYLNKVSLEKKDINDVIERNQAEFKKSFSGISTLINASQGFQEPIICISIPPLEEDDDKTNDVILVIMIKLEIILDAFKKSGITETFMVSGDGTVIAHHDPKLVLGGKNLIESPIVRGMLSSQTTNGQQSFEGEDGRRYLGSFQKLKYRFSNIGIISSIPEDKAFEAVYEIQERNIYIMIISLCISLVVIVIFAKSLSSPILSLLDETVKISKGMFKLNIQRTTNDEVGILTDYFITMAKGLEEREKVKSILGSMIDPVVVQEAMNDLVALKRGSEKTITAFFSDVAGFSNISEQLKSVDLASLLNEYLSAMTLILQRHNGVLDKYIGDAIVGIFGAPVDVTNHSIKACHASLQMITKLGELREYWVKNNLYSKEAQEMDVRIGLNAGPAKVGFMGTDNMGSFTMMGDTVNLAARLEAAGKDYGVNILISEMIKDNIQNEFFIRELDLVRVKGKNEPVKLYELISTASDIPGNLKESTEIYQDAIKNYIKRDFSNAITLLNKSIKARGKKDKSANMLIERCENYIKDPPPESWDGVYTRTHK
jgi:adenylate cyclase